jgi:hypothetical protein
VSTMLTALVQQCKPDAKKKSGASDFAVVFEK